MIEDLTAILERQFDKERIAEVTTLANQLFDRDWKDKSSGVKPQQERAFEYVTRPSRKNLH
jgi:hypothetical protein